MLGWFAKRHVDGRGQGSRILQDRMDISIDGYKVPVSVLFWDHGRWGSSLSNSSMTLMLRRELVVTETGRPQHRIATGKNPVL